MDNRTDDGQKVITIAHPEHSSGGLKISEFFSINFQFLVVKFSIYLNWCVFIMQRAEFLDCGFPGYLHI